MPKVSKTEAVLHEVLDTVKTLADRVAVLERPEPVKERVLETKLEVKPQNTTVTGEAPKFPIPQEYRSWVDTILNQDFEIEIEYPNEQPGYQRFSIVVPDKYSNATREYKSQIGGRDVRSKTLENNQAVTGVKEYIELVYNNFGQDTKTLIAMDRKR